MSKLLKAVEKAKKNRSLYEQKRWTDNGDSQSESFLKSDEAEAEKKTATSQSESGGGPIITAADIARDKDETEAVMDASESAAAEEVECTLPSSFFKDDVELDKDTLAKNRILTAESSRNFTDIYNLLRTQIFHRTKKKRHNALMVTSAMPGEGKSITATNLAISIARELDQFALLVDTDMRKPSLHNYLGIEMTKGLSDHLMQNIPVHELFIKPGIDKLTFLPAGAPIRGSTEILGSPKLQELIVEMKQRYPDRYVIFDCPDLLHAPDALVFSTYVDGIIFVVEAGKTSREHVLKALNLLEGRNVIGLVLNKAHRENFEG